MKELNNFRKFLTEGAPGYDTRKFGHGLPTLESVQKEYEDKNKIKTEDIDYDAFEDKSDIDSLLALGAKAGVNMGEDELMKLSDGFEAIGDEQSDAVASHLNMAIELIQDGETKSAVPHMRKFNKACKDEIAMDVEMRDKKDRRAGINPLMELEQERDPVKILRGLMRRGEEMVDFANKQSEYEGGVSTPVRGVLSAATVAGAPEFDINGKTDYDLLDYWKRKLEKAFITMKGRKYMDGFFDNSKARFNELNEVATPFDLLDSAHSDTSMDLRKYISQNEPDLLPAFLDAEKSMRYVLDDMAYAGAPGDEATKRRRNHQAQSSDILGYVEDPSNPLGEPLNEDKAFKQTERKLLK